MSMFAVCARCFSAAVSSWSSILVSFEGDLLVDACLQYVGRECQYDFLRKSRKVRGGFLLNQNEIQFTHAPQLG